MSSPTYGAQAQRVPAWKRLGLKLKQPQGPAGAPPPSGTAAAGSRPNGAEKQVLGLNASAAGPVKRKQPDHPTALSSSSTSPLKKIRTTNDDFTAATPSLKKQKSVTFTPDTKRPAAAAQSETKTPTKKPKPNGKPAKKKTQEPTADIKPALAYLQTWKTSRATWKFNKNHQSLLMKRVFDANAIPSDTIESFYEYIRDLKGFTRRRLREAALEIQKEDEELLQRGAKGSEPGGGADKRGFPEGTMDAEQKEAEYEAIIAGIMRLGGGGGAGTKRKRFDEVEFVSRGTDGIVTHRVIKRMRAEMILEELSEEEDEGAVTDAGNTTGTDATDDEGGIGNSTRMTNGYTHGAAKVGDGTQPRARRRKMRTAADDTSSEESSSDEDSDAESGSSDSDSSSSSDSDDSDSEIDAAAGDYGDSSSGSDSSDSSDEESDTSDESDSEDDESGGVVTGVVSSNA